MKLNFRFGKRFGFDRLKDEHKTVVERGEISEEEAERLLGVGVRIGEWRIGASSGDRAREGDQPPPDPEDAKAREMIERIAREVDAETGG